MRLCIAGTNAEKKPIQDTLSDCKFMLESYYYVQDWQIPMIREKELFLIDSGAFTFMSSNNGTMDWDDYIRRYGKFINDTGAEHFFELDIDSIVGYDKVKEYRKRLEEITGKKSIPVWHKSRGKEEFIRMCEEYDYVALGGIAIKELTTQQVLTFAPWFIKTAHQYGCKIHGLGCTSLNALPKLHFDSVDSTSWLSGARFGIAYKYNNGTIEKYTAPEGMRTVDRNRLNVHNLKEWLKFQRYAEENL